MRRRNGRGRRPEDKLFATTRGGLLVLLCGGRRTVSELASALNLTNNAVRAQLERLGRDGLVQPAGSRRGVRRPHVDYEITEKARRLFPTAYEPVLAEMLEVCADELPRGRVEKLLRDTLGRLARRSIGKMSARGSRNRVSEIMERIEPYAPGVTAEAKAGGEVIISSCSCPLASLTAAHPHLCQLIAATLAQLLHAPVEQRCEREKWPRCCFEVTPDTRSPRRKDARPHRA